MVPDIDPATIQNTGERLFYEVARQLSSQFTVFYSYEYVLPRDTVREVREGEADFIVVHPELGFVVVEVKQGELVYEDGVWKQVKDEILREIRTDPVRQARKSMYAVLARYRQMAKRPFPLAYRFAVCFPQCGRISGALPAGVEGVNVLLSPDLLHLEERIHRLAGPRKRGESQAARFLVQDVLAPRFHVFSRLEERIQWLETTAERVLTEEQERILDETELDNRKIFFGAAGTGKTFLAMEKARRLQKEGKCVFLTCFNRALADYLKHALPGITCSAFLDYLVQVLREGDPGLSVPTSEEAQSRFFTALPDAAT
ncbi:MAG: NERD domain-containing protein/DEAD/DEAH box helicase [Bacillota bacterium]